MFCCHIYCAHHWPAIGTASCAVSNNNPGTLAESRYIVAKKESVQICHLKRANSLFQSNHRTVKYLVALKAFLMHFQDY